MRELRLADAELLAQRCKTFYRDTHFLITRAAVMTDNIASFLFALDMNDGVRKFIPVSIAVLTASDTRTADDDKSGRALTERLTAAGHRRAGYKIVPDDVHQIRAAVANWIADAGVQAVITTGGTGVSGRDGSPEAVTPLLDKALPGFGEMFRALSYDDIGASTLQSRALAGVANGTYIFVLPGSTGACILAWEKLISVQLDYRTRPCNLVEMMPRLLEK